MRWLLLTLMIVTCASLVVAQEPQPTPTDVATANKISQEHKITRQYITKEMDKQREEFFEQLDDRANYYEKTADDMLSNAVYRLGFLWTAVVFVVFGINNFLRLKLEKRRISRLKKALKDEILNDRNPFLPPKAPQNLSMDVKENVANPQPNMSSTPPQAVSPVERPSPQFQQPTPQQPQQKTLSRRQEKRYLLKLRKYERYKDMINNDIMKLNNKYRIPVVATPQPVPQQPQPQQPIPQENPQPQPIQESTKITHSFEVGY